MTALGVTRLSGIHNAEKLEERFASGYIAAVMNCPIDG
jgi:hypothetical protein